MTIGGITDPSTIERSYNDITAILRANRGPYKVTEERTPDGRFKSLIIEN